MDINVINKTQQLMCINPKFYAQTIANKLGHLSAQASEQAYKAATVANNGIGLLTKLGVINGTDLYNALENDLDTIPVANPLNPTDIQYLSVDDVTLALGELESTRLTTVAALQSFADTIDSDKYTDYVTVFSQYCDNMIGQTTSEVKKFKQIILNNMSNSYQTWYTRLATLSSLFSMKDDDTTVLSMDNLTMEYGEYTACNPFAAIFGNFDYAHFFANFGNTLRWCLQFNWTVLTEFYGAIWKGLTNVLGAVENWFQANVTGGCYVSFDNDNEWLASDTGAFKLKSDMILDYDLTQKFKTTDVVYVNVPGGFFVLTDFAQLLNSEDEVSGSKFDLYYVPCANEWITNPDTDAFNAYGFTPTLNMLIDDIWSYPQNITQWMSQSISYGYDWSVTQTQKSYVERTRFCHYLNAHYFWALGKQSDPFSYVLTGQNGELGTNPHDWADWLSDIFQGLDSNDQPIRNNFYQSSISDFTSPNDLSTYFSGIINATATYSPEYDQYSYSNDYLKGVATFLKELFVLDNQYIVPYNVNNNQFTYKLHIRSNTELRTAGYQAVRNITIGAVVTAIIIIAAYYGVKLKNDSISTSATTDILLYGDHFDPSTQMDAVIKGYKKASRLEAMSGAILGSLTKGITFVSSKLASGVSAAVAAVKDKFSGATSIDPAASSDDMLTYIAKLIYNAE